MEVEFTTCLVFGFHGHPGPCHPIIHFHEYVQVVLTDSAVMMSSPCWECRFQVSLASSVLGASVLKAPARWEWWFLRGPWRQARPWLLNSAGFMFAFWFESCGLSSFFNG